MGIPNVLGSLHIPPNTIMNSMKAMHHIATKYLTYLVQSKLKIYNKQEPIQPSLTRIISVTVTN